MTYTPVDYLLMFCSSFFVVFLLGLQSKNVNQSRYFAAIVTSFGISVGQFLFAKYAATGNVTAFLTCAIGGCMGIAFSIWFYDTVLHKRREKKTTQCIKVVHFKGF